jgi:hypothetical protein
MANPNIKPSSQVAQLAVMNPISQGAATVTSAWVSLANADAILAVLMTGVMGASGTIDAKLQQASDGSGTGAKDISGKAITQLVKASNDNDQVMINCRSDELDVANGFTHVRLSITVGTAASLIAAYILGFYGRYQPVSHGGDVVEVVG